MCLCFVRRWLPRRKLEPLGVDADIDGVKLTANNKANVCAAVQRAYDRARQQMSSDTTSTPAAETETADTHQNVASCDTVDADV